MALVKVRRAGQITLPLEIRQAVGISVGDTLEAEVTRAGILLRPVTMDRRDPTPEQEAGILAVGITGTRSRAELVAAGADLVIDNLKELTSRVS